MSHPGVAPGVTDFDGYAKINVSHNQVDKFWRINRLSVDAAGGVVTVTAMVNDQPCTSSKTGPTPLAATGEPVIDIGGHDTLNIVVTKGPPQTNVRVTYYYEEIAGQP
jgi:hypothetical protein